MSVGSIFGGGADLVILLRGAYLIYRSLIVRYSFFAYTGGGDKIDRYCGRGDGGITISAFAGDGAGRGITSRVCVAFTCTGCGNSGVGVFNTGDTSEVASREVLDCFASSRCYYLLAMYFTRVSRF